MIIKYIQSLNYLTPDSKSFIIRQINRMPDFYKFGVTILCSVFYILRLKPDSLTLFEKLISSLDKVRVNE